ncbi:uncharacterized protein NPIL_485521 [Nephila pilipes]|uniref:Uncharacterized protein n=1 Tax=Nephila pilipes TaxID=299642 RepID=A0A8X6Q071_NEPPI|nr:uncharacterized protein NPIL_485521 [Nephila pilipes]
MLLIFMLGQIPKLSFPGCLYLLAIERRSLPKGLPRSWTASLRTDDGTYRLRRISLILGLEVCHPRICLTIVCGGKALVSYHHQKRTDPSNQF